jgi:hypothetical protein
VISPKMVFEHATKLMEIAGRYSPTQKDSKMMPSTGQ